MEGHGQSPLIHCCPHFLGCSPAGVADSIFPHLRSPSTSWRISRGKGVS